ncbi:MAG: hypothetical protein BGO21_08635 [Dyadobacter sp. 50-39]|uniref:relaxase/mobilization nuclease domain-containing protein n=1 Tax=Dyadobacter sp. 50-39 TaxID=1895756 RepID=UPI000964D3BF|nr:relaxase/mobilization nuclease domain-containing protein [Dyadobacter sp. 50-39]OJV19313.1 MAG: hypothetical protein BGO21_08635 [Dyadobacter sp. 50-39]
MIYKATKVKSVRHAGMLARHLLRADENEIVDVLEIRGTARPDDLAASLRSMQRATDLTRGKTGLFSVAINPRDHEADSMTPEQWERSLDALEEEFKELSGQPRAVVRHRKNNRSHVHVVYQLTNTETGTLIDLRFDKRRCQKIGRSLELEFGHEQTPQEPSRDSYTRDEQQQAKRLGEKIPERRQQLRADLDQSGNLGIFMERLTAKGYTIAKGDRAGVVLIDTQGEVFGFGRELGLKAAEVRKLLGQQIEYLPTIDQVRSGSYKITEEPTTAKAAATRQDDTGTATAYRQEVAVTFNTEAFKAAQVAHRLSEQQREEQAEREKQQRIAQRLKEWDEQEQIRQRERNRNRGLDLSR